MAFTVDFFFWEVLATRMYMDMHNLGGLKLVPNKYLQLECLKLPRHEVYLLSGLHFTKENDSSKF